MDDIKGHRAQAKQVKTYNHRAQEQLRKQKFLEKLEKEAAKRRKQQRKQQY
jgi:hypothetical protein